MPDAVVRLPEFTPIHQDERFLWGVLDFHPETRACAYDRASGGLSLWTRDAARRRDYDPLRIRVARQVVERISRSTAQSRPA